MFVFNRGGINARADSDQVRGFTKSKKKHMLKISAAIWKAEIPIHYTTWATVEQALLNHEILITVFPHMVSAETILFWIWKSKGHST